MEAYSSDLRCRILRACAEGTDTREGVADTFRVSRSFVQKLLRRWRQGDEIAPRPHSGGVTPALDEAALEELRWLVRAKPDATLAELCLALKDTGHTAVSRATVCRALQTLDLPVKKSPCMRTSGTVRGCGRCAGGGGARRGRRTRTTLCLSTKAGLTPR